MDKNKPIEFLTSLKQYLLQHHTQSTAYGYYRTITIYLQQQTNAEEATYKEIINYVSGIRSRYSKATTVKSILNGIKKYYDYLLYSGIRSDHPCRNLNIKDCRHKDVQIQDLLSEQQLEGLLSYESKRFKTVLSVRNKALLSLLVYQGLNKGELKRLTIDDLDIESGNIYIKGSHSSNSRTIKLHNKQIMLLYKYVTEIRPELLEQAEPQIITNNLFITIKGKPETGSSLKYIFQQIKQQQGLKLTINLIRQSVIANKLKRGNDIRMVQIFAGHKNASSTERYKPADIEQLKAVVNKYHPMKLASIKNRTKK